MVLEQHLRELAQPGPQGAQGLHELMHREPACSARLLAQQCRTQRMQVLRERVEHGIEAFARRRLDGRGGFGQPVAQRL